MKQFYSFFISILLFFSTLPVVGYAAYSISPFPNLYFCVSVYPSSYQTVNFSLDESTLANEFTLSQASKTLILTLPTGFEFNTAIGPTVTRGLAPRDITINSFTWTTSAITVTISTDGSPSSIDHILFNNFQIRAIAAGSGNLLRLSPSLGTFLISGSVDLPGDGSPNPAQSFGQMLAAPTMTYNSSAVVQYTIADINRNCTSTHNPVLEIQVNVTSNSCPAIISQFNFSTAGDVGFSQNPLINITKAKLYYTGQTPGYAYTSLFGSVNAPNGAFTINGSQQLTLGTGIYYFYLTYDVPGTANIGDRLDASMTSFVIDGITKSDMATPNPLGTRNIILGGPCSLQPDVPNPPANLKTVTAGSLVIPMDNAHQNLWAGYPFNIKAYGLINSLLQNDIPVKWVIKSGKIKDGIDFSANAGRVYPSIVAAAMQDFRGGAFIVDTTWLNQPFYAGGLTATQVITAFANTWKVAVYQLTATITVDVRYTLNQRPKIAVFNNGGNQLLQTAMLDSAKYPNYVAINSGLFTGLAECYTFCSESHWAGTVADTSITASVRAFVNSGGNFLAQCKGIDTYENFQGPFHFQSTNGITIVNNAIINAYYNPDLAYMQFEGAVVANPGGSEVNWVLNGGSWVSGFYYGISSSTNPDNIFTGGAHLTSPDSTGSNAFYLGGHSFAANWNLLTYINAQRMYLNAALIPAHRPTAFLLNPGLNRSICQGQSTTLGGSPTGPAGSTYNWSPATSLSSSTSANPVATPTVTTTYTVVANNGGCPGGPSYVTVTVVPIPSTPVAGSNSPICASNTLNLTANTIAGATYSWTGPNSFSSVIQNPSIAGATVLASGTYSVTATVAGCTSLIGTTSVTVTSTPLAPTAGSNSPICEGNTLNLTASVIAGATYSWIGPNSFSSAIQNPSIAGATVFASGTYSVTATVAGCTSVAGTVSVTINPTPIAPTVGSNSPVCIGSLINLTSNTVVGATYSWTGPNAFISALEDPTIASATAAMAGTYSLTVTVAGCTSPVATTGVVVNPTPVAPTAGSNSPVCIGSQINLTSNTVAGATYSWTGPNAFSSALEDPTIAGATAAMAGTYSLTVTVAGCTSPVATTTVVVNPAPTAPTAGSNSPVCVGSIINLTSNTVAGATYSWTGPSAFSSALEDPTIVAATAAMAGTYSLTVTVAGCTSLVATTTVVVSPTPVAPTAGSNSPVCAGTTINLTSNTVIGATYSWTGPSAFSSALEDPTIASATAAMAGTYSVTVTVGGCTSPVATTTVVVNPIPATPSPSSNSPVCTSFSLNLTTTAVAGAIYSWTGPNAFSSALQNPTIASASALAAGTYSLTITVAGCTSAIGTTSVIVNPTPVALTAGSNSPVCAGTTINLTSNTIVGGTYSWTGPGAFVSALEDPTRPGATVAMAGTYSVTVTVAGCTSPVATTVVIVNPIPATPTAGSNSPICIGATLNLTTSAVVGGTYSWTGPNSFSSALQNPTIPGATALATGTYSITVTVAGCTSAAGIVAVSVNTAPVSPTAGSNSPVCTGTALNLTASFIAGATYSWTGPNAFSSTLQNPTIVSTTALAAGTYTVVANNGCSSSPATTVVVVNPTPITPTAGSNSPICVGSTLNLTSNTIAGATYSWTGPNTFSSALEDPSIAGATTLASGTYSVTATVGGCTSAFGTTIVVVNPIPVTPSPSSNSPVCTGFSLNLTTTAIAGAIYSWTGPNAFSSALQNPTIASASALAAGTYSLTVTVAGCTSAIGTTSVIVNPTPAALTAGSNSPVCAGTTINLTSNTIVGGTYSWTGPSAFVSALEDPSIAGATAAMAGTYSVTVTVSGCTSPIATTTVVINPIPITPTAGSNSPICIGATLNLTTSAVVGATYSWTGPNSFSSALQNPTIPGATALATGTYSITITVAGCTSAAGTVAVTVNSAPVSPTASSNTPVCTGDSLLLSSSTIAGATYSWTGPNAFTSTLQNPFIANTTLLGAGTYTVVANNGCASSPATTVVVVNPTPITPTAGSNSPICVGSTLNLTSNTVAGATYSWTGPNSFSSALEDPTIVGATTLASGTYSVTTTVGGCTSAFGTVIVVVNQPAVSTAGPNQTVCANNAIVNISGTVTGGSTTGIWSTSGTGTFSPSNTNLIATYNPTNADTTSGSVTLTLTSTSNGACPASTSSLVVTITNAPTVNAGVDQSVCANNANTSLNGIVTTATGGVWTSSGSGTFSPSNTTLNATYIPSSADTASGTVTLTLTSTGNGTCLSVSDAMVVTITNAPSVNAGANQFVCLSSPNSNLSGTIIGGAGTGIWTTSGSGTFSPSATSLNPTYIPSSADTAAGSVTIILTTTANGGCTAVSDSLIINYTIIPVVNAGSDQTVCANNASVLLNGTVNGTSNTGIWTTSGSGTFNPSVTTLNATYIPSAADTTAGSVTLTLSSTNSCAIITDIMVITITDGPSVSAGANVSVCANSPNANLSAVISGATTTGIWSTAGTGSITPSTTSLNITYAPSATDITNGSVNLIITSTGNGTCNPVSDTVTIIITPPPTAFAGNDTSFCANTTLQLSGIITGGVGTGIWTTSGSGTFSPLATTLNAIYIPSSADTLSGTVTLTLTSTNNGGCIAVSDAVILTITNAPTASANIDQTVCSNNSTVILNGSVTTATGGTWTTSGTGTFNVATNLNANYTPSAADILSGAITLTLTTTGNGNCNPVSDFMVVNFSPSPIVNANINQFICTGTTTAVLNGSVSGGTTTGQWTTLGSGTFSLDTDMNATYTLSNADTTAGFVTLILTSTNNGTCIAVSDTMQITITTIPTSSAGLNQILCANNAAAILNGIITGGSGMGQWSTYNGTGSFTPSDTTLNAIYNSSSADTAQGFVSLVLTPINSCLNIPDTLQITFTPAPFIFAGNNQTICNGGTINLSATTNSVSSGMIWTTSGTGTFTPNDSTLSVTYIPSVADAALNTIYFYATTTGNGTCFAATDTVMVLLGNTPVADFTSIGNCSGQVVSFADASTVSSGTVNGWSWYFGDSNTSLLQNPTNMYTTAGTYTVTLVSSSGAGCSDSIVKVIVINPLPTVAFSYVSNCTSDSVLFTDNSTIVSGTISQWSWNFGDSTSSALQNPIQIYSVIDTFSVTLTVTSDSGCVASITQNVIVAPRPTANFGYSINCAIGIALFTDSSLVSGGDTIISYNWNFGNGNTSILQNPLAVMYTPGTYIVQLVVTTQSGCIDMDSVTIIILAPPIADYLPQGGSYLIGQTINFTDQSQNASSYYWTFGNNNDTSIVQNPSYSYGANGSYVVTLIASNASGCSDTAAYKFEVIGSPVVVPSAFSPNGDLLNDVFRINGGPFNSYELRVFNEWGQQIFYSNNQSNGWDGKYKNKEQPAGSYVYIFVGVTYTNEDVKLHGEIAITR